MPDPSLTTYIQTALAQGSTPQSIEAALTATGWPLSDVQTALQQLVTPTSSAPLPSPPVSTFSPASPFPTSPADTTIVTEKDYPITLLWVFKAPIIIIVVSVIAFFFGFYFPYLIIAFPIYLIANPLVRANFHYATQAAYFEIRQGVISKKQRHLPYGVIQHVFVKQDLFDRLFGLASLAVENAAEGGGKGLFKRYNQRNQGETVGSSGNKVNIPGLKKADAEALKEVILQKMKANPVENTQAGL